MASPSCRKPGPGPGLSFNSVAQIRSSGDLLERLGHAFLDRLGGVGRDLLGESGKLLALAGQRQTVKETMAMPVY